MAADLKSVNKKLQAVLKEQSRLQLHRAYDDDHTVHTRTVLKRRNRQEADRDTVGTAIEDDTHLLVHRLTQQQGQAACEGVAIVGPDGIGKTTLAKAVYESASVRCSFETRSWIRLLRGHTEAGLLSQTIDAIGGGGDATGDESVADLKAMLTGLVANKRFLLVVDDVWDGGVWKDVLRDPLEHGGRGSKVLITARHDNIAREMGACHVHQVNRLSAADGWLLLRVSACVADDEIDASQLKGVGERLVDKCNGIPLAIDSVAGLLRTREASAGEWTEVLKSPAWLVKGLPDNAMTPLYMCYADLPCHLKQCFLYCSLFPPGFTVDRRVLVHKWIAERFVQARIGATVEEVAGEYYDELVGRNLLQTTTEEYAHPGRCTMHGMLHALAQLLLQGEGFTGDFQLLPSNDSDDVSLALRRVSLPGRNMAAIPERILKSDGIRTLLLPKNPLATASDILERMHHLRVVDLSETAIDLVPETLGNIIHLRFLNLSRTRIQEVPVSIGNLRSLEFLLLTECKSLHALPKSIEHLTRLRDLDLAGTAISAGAFRVGQLGSLTSLRSFAVASKGARATQDRGHWPLAELRYLYQLRTLHVHKLEKAGGPAEAAEASLAGKRRLQELVLSCSSGTVNLLQTPTAATKIEAVFQELNPPEYLESLKIANYFGAKFPTWLSAILLPNLRRLDIIGCNIPLPPLGQLPELRSLCIADSSAPRFIDVEFMGTCNHHQVPFPKLDNLHLRGLHKLETWIEIGAGALPCLQAMQLESCPELRCLPGGLTHVTSLMELRIVDMASLKAVEDIAALRELSVWNTPILTRYRACLPSRTLAYRAVQCCRLWRTSTRCKPCTSLIINCRSSQGGSSLCKAAVAGCHEHDQAAEKMPG